MADPLKLDAFLTRSLLAFLKAQHQAYVESMPLDNKNIAENQATYEISNLAMATVARFVTDTAPDDMLPEAWQKPMETMHNLVCEFGDNKLRSRGYDPDSF